MSCASRSSCLSLVVGLLLDSWHGGMMVSRANRKGRRPGGGSRAEEGCRRRASMVRPKQRKSRRRSRRQPRTWTRGRRAWLRRPEEAGELYPGRGADSGRELHRLPQSPEIRKQVRDDHVHAACQGGPARRGDHARAGQTGREQPGRADQAHGKLRMPYKLDPLPAEKIAIIEAGWPRVPNTTAARPAKTGRCWSPDQRSTIPAAYPATVPITALQFSPERDDCRIRLS